MPESGICCSMVKLTSAPPSMKGRWSSDGDIIGSLRADTMAGRASPGAGPCAGGLDLISPLAGDATDVGQRLRRWQARLLRGRWRPLGARALRPERKAV